MRGSLYGSSDEFDEDLHLRHLFRDINVYPCLR